MAKWVIGKKQGDADKLSRELSVSPVMARVLINRRLTQKDAAAYYLSNDMPMLPPIEDMDGVKKAYEIIAAAIDNKTKICIYGDYDVDGVMSTVILYKALKGLSAYPSYYIPNRETEGYGLNAAAIKKIHSEGHGLLIACDNGIVSVANAALARELGMKMIIIDHHEQGDTLPDADAVIDPKKRGCPYKYKQMCAAGITFRIVCGLYKYLFKENGGYDEYLTLAAIATICDIVDLNGENRAIAKAGLAMLNKNTVNIGLKALMDARGLKKTVGEYEIGFIIGPCINAAGRLSTADMAVKLLLTDNADEVKELANTLARLNDTRRKMTEDAIKNCNGIKNNSAINIIYDNNIHESIAGIVAGRIKDKTKHPVIVLTDSAAAGIAKGSARSIEGYNIHAELSKCAHLFERFGGHAMAAGLSLKKERINELDTALNDNCGLTEADFEEKIVIDEALSLSDVTYTIAKELSALAPFGKGNREPLFGTKGARVSELKIYPDKNTIRFTFAIEGSYRRITGINFGMTEEFTKMITDNYEERIANKIMAGVLRQANLTLDIVYSIEINEYNDSVSVNLNIKDFRKGGIL